MSNTLAISTVSAAFARRLRAAATQVVDNATVRLGTPTAKLAENNKPVVNLHLYRVEPNTSHGNNHFPSRDSSGNTVGPNQLVMNLHYVVSFYGNHESFEPDLMLGEVMLSFEGEPELTKTTVKSAIDENTDELQDSDLHKALGKLRVSRQLKTLDEFSRIWSLFYQVPYVISLVYEVEHVVIQSEQPKRQALPVARPQLWVAPLSKLRLDNAGGSNGSMLLWNGVFELQGEGLGTLGLAIEVDGITIAPSSINQLPDKIDVTLNAANLGGSELEAGIHRAQVIMPPKASQPAYLTERSNAIPFSLHPLITPGAVTAPAGGTTATGSLKVTFAPKVAAQQSVRLLLDSRNAAQPGQTVIAGREPTEVGTSQAELTFEFENLLRGDYLLRADVDGLISPVEHDAASGEITGPVVTI